MTARSTPTTVTMTTVTMTTATMTTMTTIGAADEETWNKKRALRPFFSCGT